MSVLQAIVGDDSWGTVAANGAAVIGLFTLVPIALSISGSLKASVALNAQLLHTTFKLVDGELWEKRSDLPPGDQSRVFYEVYAISRSWNAKLWDGNLVPSALPQQERAAYERHVAESLFLLNRTLIHAPDAVAKEAWVKHINKHVYAHGRLLSAWLWRYVNIWRYSSSMRTLIRNAPNPKAPRREATG